MGELMSSDDVMLFGRNIGLSGLGDLEHDATALGETPRVAPQVEVVATEAGLFVLVHSTDPAVDESRPPRRRNHRNYRSEIHDRCRRVADTPLPQLRTSSGRPRWINLSCPNGNRT